MTAGRVTIYEVAERAGVSISTVSNALNRPDRVKAATRARVLSVADELGFVPKAQAVSLARQGTRTVGVMAPFTSYSSYLRRLAGVLRAASEAEVDVLVFDHESAARSAAPLLGSLPVQGRLDGLVVMGFEIDSVVEQRLQQRKLPIVVVDAESDAFSKVLVDDVEGGRVAGRHLVGKGHRRFGYLLEQQAAEYESQGMRRLAGFTEIVTPASCGDVLLETSANSIDAARQAAGRLLDRSNRPTAIMAHHDILALGVLLAAKDRNLQIPNDVAVMGFDDLDVAAAADLTTVHQPFEESGATALRILLRQVGGDRLRSSTTLDLQLVERSST